MAAVWPLVHAVTVGNAALGGQGKTPMVRALARLARARYAARPIVATRGVGADEDRMLADDENVSAVLVDGDRGRALAAYLQAAPAAAVQKAVPIGGGVRPESGETCSGGGRLPLVLLDDGLQSHGSLTARRLLMVSAAARPSLIARVPLARAAGRCEVVVVHHADVAGPAAVRAVRDSLRDVPAALLTSRMGNMRLAPWRGGGRLLADGGRAFVDDVAVLAVSGIGHAAPFHAKLVGMDGTTLRMRASTARLQRAGLPLLPARRGGRVDGMDGIAALVPVPFGDHAVFNGARLATALRLLRRASPLPPVVVVTEKDAYRKGNAAVLSRLAVLADVFVLHADLVLDDDGDDLVDRLVLRQ